jgi:uracil-DNA glycosylase family 4
MKGFHSEIAWGKMQVPLPVIPQCEDCLLYKDCQSPRMPVSGGGRRKVLICGEAPGEIEDSRNRQFVGRAGMELVRLLHRIGVNMRKDCWLHNAIICRPTDRNGDNRKPIPKEVNCCRPNLNRAIRDLQPEIIIPMGETATRSLMAIAWRNGEVHNISRWRGWNIPCAKLGAWICPTFHPSYLLQSKNGALEGLILKDLRQAFSNTGRPPAVDWKSRVKIITDPKKVRTELACFIAFGRPLAFDYETNMLKPDSKKAEIICCSVSDGNSTIAYPWVGEAIAATDEFLRSDVPKIAWNMGFEERWTRRILKHSVKNWWRDGMLGTHWDSCIHGICGLDFQAFVRLGVQDYSSHLDKYMKSDNDNSVNRLREVDLHELLLYCGLDSLFEAKLAYEIWEKADIATNAAIALTKPRS